MEQSLLKIQELKKYFPIRKGLFKKQIGIAKVVDDISFNIGKGEVVGLIGESGAGKSILLQTIALLRQPTEGKVVFNGQDLADCSKKELKKIRKQMQLIPQDHQNSLHPRMTIREILKEPLKIHGIGSKDEKERKARGLLELVELESNYLNRFPHQLSGGQKQRVAIARALALRPELILCDEPVSALDVSIQAQILNLFMDLQKQFGLSYLFVAQDLAVLRQISYHILVLYLGKFIEIGLDGIIYENPLHPYTKTFLDASPSIKKNIYEGERIPITWGDVPTPLDPPAGCAFHPRCNQAIEICQKVEPKLEKVNEKHFVACHRVNE